MPTEARSIHFGGGGLSYFYVTPSRKKSYKDDTTDLHHRFNRYKYIIHRELREDEVFLFTIKEPLKSVISRLMDLFKKINEENPIPDIKKLNIPIVSGPLGYTNLFAFRPIIPSSKEILFKPVVK